MADWSSIVADIAAQHPVAKSSVKVTFHRADVLAQPFPAPVGKALEDASLVVLAFTITELMQASRARTVALLDLVSAATATGSRLIVVESAALARVGSTALDGGESVSALLSRALRDSWTLEIGEEDQWYRHSKTSAYPLKLENARVLKHVYTRR